MTNLINIFWNPDEKILQGFKYGSYVILAPTLLLSFIIPSTIVLGLLFLYFILKTVVTLRAAAIHEIDRERLEKYSGKDSIAKRSFVIFSVMIVIFIIGIVCFYFITGGMLGLISAIFITTIALPGFFEEIIIIKRCQASQRP